MRENMWEKPPIYDESGRIINPEIAREAAEIEKKYHKRTLGIFSPSREKIMEGEQEAERHIEKGKEINLEELPASVKEEIKRIKDNYKSTRNEQLALYDEVTKADIGGEVTRFRLEGYLVGEDAIEGVGAIFTPGIIATNIEVIDESGDEFNPDLAKEVELIIDIKDNSVVRSEEKVEEEEN